MNETTQFENEELEKNQHFEAMERVGQINLFEDAYQQEKLKADEAVKESAQEPVEEQAKEPTQNESTTSDGERIAHIGEREAENGAQNQPNGEPLEQGSATLFEQAVAKIEAEMKSDKTSYVQDVGQYLIEFLKLKPETAEQFMQKDKSIAKSLMAMRKVAEKRQVNGFAGFTANEGFSIVLEYYGIQGGPAAPIVDVSQIAKQSAENLATKEQTPAPAQTVKQVLSAPAVETARKPSKLSFDVDIDELL